MRLNTAASSCLRSALAGPPQPATWLGVTPAAVYLRMSSAPGVIALLAHDAVRLPCGLLLPTTAKELPLTCLAGAAGDAMVGAGRLEWTGPAGRVVVSAVREWLPARVRPGLARAEVLGAISNELCAPAAVGIDGELLAHLTTRPAEAVQGLLGRGPGLTPAGDDVLAGFVLGASAVGLDAAAVLTEVAATAATRTTALSAALLWHAARGECIDEVAALVAHPSGPTLGRLLRVGHTSGFALASGLTTAALAALRTRRAGEAA